MFDPTPSQSRPGSANNSGAKASVQTPLTQLRQGERAIVDIRDLPEAESKLLAAMGLSERCEIRVCRAGTPCIVQIHTIRVGIGREVAERIQTTPCGCEGTCEADRSGGQGHPPAPPDRPA